MRVLLLTDADVFAGTERHIADLAAALLRPGIAVTVACPSPSPLAERCARGGIDVLALPKRGPLDWRVVRGLAQFIRSGGSDDDVILHAHNGRMLLHAALAKSLTRGARLVSTQHFLRPSRMGRRGVTRWFSSLAHRWVGARVDRFIAISGAVRREMLARGDADDTRVDGVPNGIAAVPQSDFCDRDALLAKEGMDATSRVVFCASRLEREKDVATLIRAMPAVRCRHPGVVCCIAGDGALRPELEREIRERDLIPFVRLLGFRDDVPALMSASDLFVLPCPNEGFGLVLLEAMAAGKAVVATRAGGPIEIVDEGRTGVLVPPGDADAMGNAIAALLGDDERRARMGQAGRRRLEERFTADRMAEATLAVYHKALGSNAGRDGVAAADLLAVPREATRVT